MSNTLKTILVTIAVLVWTGVVALGSAVVTWKAAEYEYEPQLQAAKNEAWYWHNFDDYCHEQMDGTLLGGSMLVALEETYAEAVDEANPEMDFSQYR